MMMFINCQLTVYCTVTLGNTTPTTLIQQEFNPHIVPSERFLKVYIPTSESVTEDLPAVETNQVALHGSQTTHSPRLKAIKYTINLHFGNDSKFLA